MQGPCHLRLFSQIVSLPLGVSVGSFGFSESQVQHKSLVCPLLPSAYLSMLHGVGGFRIVSQLLILWSLYGFLSLLQILSGGFSFCHVSLSVSLGVSKR